MSNKKLKQPAADNVSDEAKFKTIAHEVGLLIRRLTARGICGGCICHGLIFHGAYLLADIAGPEEAVSLCLDIVDLLEQPDEAGEKQTQH